MESSEVESRESKVESRSRTVEGCRAIFVIAHRTTGSSLRRASRFLASAFRQTPGTGDLAPDTYRARALALAQTSNPNASKPSCWFMLRICRL